MRQVAMCRGRYSLGKGQGQRISDRLPPVLDGRIVARRSVHTNRQCSWAGSVVCQDEMPARLQT